MGLMDKMNQFAEKGSKNLFEKYVLPNETFLFGYNTVAITDEKIMALDDWKFKFVPFSKITMVEVKRKGVITVFAGSKEIEFDVGIQNIDKAMSIILEIMQE